MELVAWLNSRVLWGIPMMILMLGTGLFLTVITGGVIFRKFGIILRYTILTLFRKRDKQEKKEGAITPFQALCTALAATVGTGNIVGVALAIATGGPGAVFWLWISALVGMVIKYCEVTVSVAYRSVNEKGQVVGGPMYYITKGLNAKWLAVLFSCFGAAAGCGVGAAVQSNSIATSLHGTFFAPTWVVGAVLTVLAALVILGGIRRIAGVTEVLVPFMAVFYIAGALVALCINAKAVPEAIAMIFRDAFTGTAATGGFLGASVRYACRIGMARGVFTHEAGMGSAPIAHASADTDHPARQGLWGAFEVFVDSIVLCTITALVILTSGLWKREPQLPGSVMSSQAFAQAFSGGQYVVILGLVLFAFATIISWYYYGEKCAEFVFRGNPVILGLYRLAYLIMVYVGCISGLDAVWEFADLFNGLMALPNLIALIGLSPVIRRLTKDFFSDPHRLRPREEGFGHLLQ